jgi:hypothetical protein
MALDSLIRERGVKKKGQMFIIAAIIILVGLVEIRGLLGLYATFEEKRSEETFVLDKQVKNMRSEFAYTLGIATLQSDANLSGIRFLYNFSNFTAADAGAKLLYAFVFANSSTQRFGVTVGNFLKDTINITINATNSTPAGYSFAVNDKINASREFQSNINGTVNITLTYSYQNENITERFPIIASAQRFASVFVDATLEISGEFIRSKEFYNRTW